MKFKFFHYGIMLLTILSGGVMYFAVTRDLIAPISPFSSLGQALQYIVIFDTLICVPLGVWMNAKRNALVGMLLASHPMLPAIVCAYWMGGYRSMLYLAGISAIAWYFTKHRIL